MFEHIGTDGFPGRKRLGTLLTDRGLVSSRQVEMALLEQTRTGALLGEILDRRARFGQLRQAL